MFYDNTKARPFRNKIKRRAFILIITILCLYRFPCTAQNTVNDPNCEICANISSYPQIASLDGDDGFFSQLIFNQLLGMDVNLTALNWMGLTQYNFELEQLIFNLSQEFNLSSPQAVLMQELTIDQLLTALATVASNDGTVAALNEIITANMTTGTIQLGDLLNIDTIDDSLANIDLNFYSFLNTAIQLYNYENVVVTNAPIDINIPIVGDISIQAQVVEPPNITCADTGMQLFSAGIRLKLIVDIVDVAVSSTEGTADLELTLTELELYVDIARGLTTVNAVNGPSNTVNLELQPGLARLFLGSIADSDFFDRTKDPIDSLTFGIIGKLHITAPLVDETLDISAKGSADASSILHVENGLALPFNITAGNSSATISELINQLLANTEIKFTSDVPLSPFVSNLLAIVKDDLVGSVNTLLFPENGIVHNIMSFVVDPILSSLGIAIGEVIVEGDQLIETCLDMGDAPDIYNTSLTNDGARHAIDSTLYMGPIQPDSDSDGHPDMYANYDSKDDGVDNFSYFIEEGVYIVDATITNTSEDTAQLIAWIDFNNNGVFENNYERSVMSSHANVDSNYTGSVVIIWDSIPEGTSINGRYARFRLSSDPNFFNPSLASPNGFARDGEVEDYYISEQILPIELLRFQVSNIGEDVKIEWETAAEINLDEYNIEKSLDGKTFYQISTHHSEDVDEKLHSYSYIDREDTHGTLYYRLKSLDLDGQFSYSAIRSIHKKSSFNTHIAPNPFVDLLNVTINNSYEAETTISIYNSQHQLIHNTVLDSESRQINLDLGSFPDGIYILTTTNKNNTESKLLFKN